MKDLPSPSPSVEDRLLRVSDALARGDWNDSVLQQASWAMSEIPSGHPTRLALLRGLAHAMQERGEDQWEIRRVLLVAEIEEVYASASPTTEALEEKLMHAAASVLQILGGCWWARAAGSNLDDLMQEVLTSFLITVRQRTPIREPVGLLRRMLMGRCRDHYRREVARRGREAVASRGDALTGPTAGSVNSTMVELAGALGRVDSELDSLLVLGAMERIVDELVGTDADACKAIAEFSRMVTERPRDGNRVGALRVRRIPFEASLRMWFILWTTLISDAWCDSESRAAELAATAVRFANDWIVRTYRADLRRPFQKKSHEKVRRVVLEWHRLLGRLGKCPEDAMGILRSEFSGGLNE